MLQRAFNSIIFTALFFTSADIWAKNILVVIPGGASSFRTIPVFDPSIVHLVAELEKEGHEIFITTPPNTGPDWVSWKKVGLDFDKFYRGFSWVLSSKAPRFDGLILFGGKARVRPVEGRSRVDPLTLFIKSPEVQHNARAFLENGAPVAALSHGVELLANTLSSGGEHSVLYGRKITGPGEVLDRRMPFSKILFGGAALGEEKVRSALRNYRDFIPGPTWRIDNLTGFIVQDQNLLTARSGRDAQRLARDFSNLFKTPEDLRFRSYYIEYPNGPKDRYQIWINILEMTPKGSYEGHTFIEYSGIDRPLEDPDVRRIMRRTVAENKKVIIWSHPRAGQNYGLANALKIWSRAEVDKLREFVVEETARGVPKQDITTYLTLPTNFVKSISKRCKQHLKLVRSGMRK